MDDEERKLKLKDADAAVSPGIEVTNPSEVKGAPPIVYKRRFFILLSYMLGYFMSNVSGGKHVILSTAFAKYHNVTNEVSATSPGIDFFSVISNIVILLCYPLGAYTVDKVGLIALTIGNFGLMIANWTRYLAFKNYWVALLSVIFSSMSLPFVASSLLAISNRWFPENERAKATGAGALIAMLGAAVGVALGSVFKTGPPLVDFTLLSCKQDKVPQAIVDAYVNATAYNVSLPCLNEYADAYTYFCCYTPARIELYNLVTALMASVVFLFSLVSVRNLPPTPPAPAAEEKPKTPFWTGFKAVFMNRRLVQINIADFLVCGPPIVLYSTVARILPKEVKSYDLVLSVIAILFAIPSSIAVSVYLDRHHTYWRTTFGAYILGTTLWLIASIGYSAGGLGGGVIVIICGALAAVSSITWQVSGYELKLEWGFRPDMNLEGLIAAFDRITTSISSLLFLLFIPPERWGGVATFWIGFGALVLGVFISVLTPNKEKYNRLEYERSVGEKGEKPKRLSVQIAGLGLSAEAD